MAGFISMQRNALDHHLFRNAPDRFYAWFWLVGHACWKQTKFDVKGKTITLERGQLCASRSQLAEAWNWSPSAVERFLSRLQTEQMIGRQTGQGRSVITIENYSKYQDRKEPTGQVTGQEDGQTSDRHRTAKEQGNNNPIPNGIGAADSDKQFWDTAKAYLGPSKASIIGQWASQHGKEATAAAITAAQLARAVDPVPYIQRVLKGAKNEPAVPL